MFRQLEETHAGVTNRKRSLVHAPLIAVVDSWWMQDTDSTLGLRARIPGTDRSHPATSEHFQLRYSNSTIPSVDPLCWLYKGAKAETPKGQAYSYSKTPCRRAKPKP
jgi:hypothetical protein